MFFLAHPFHQASNIQLGSGLVITHSVKVRPGDVLSANNAEDGRSGALTIKGNNITVDFSGATLRGTPGTTEPDLRKGTGVFVQGRNITIKNLNVRGYKIGLVAKDSPGLTIVDSDFSYNWKQHLQSTIDREDESDWMSYHHNEKDEWLRYGAGVYLRGCDRFEIKNVRIVGGQCGLMLMESNHGRMWNSNLSFLSAIGLGLYKSSENQFLHNNIDWCVRGYSHGKWNRGQDSAGILIYEQSSHNTFAYNSVTHGGDGFFLWAGQSTMDTGTGGCNDNLLYGNDFSHAPTNGIEATFSRNQFVNNLVLECWHGIWGGYSYETRVIANVFGYNAEAIAWEHGQDNMIHYNVFHRDLSGVNLWMNKTQDPNWGYPKGHDTKARDVGLIANLFEDIPGPSATVRDATRILFSENWFRRTGKELVRLQGDTPGFSFVDNTIQSAVSVDPAGAKNSKITREGTPAPSTMRADGNVILGLDNKTSDYLKRFDIFWRPYLGQKLPANAPDWAEGNQQSSKPYAVKPLVGGKDPFIKKGQLRGRRYILVDDWGPYDFKRPLLWPRTDLIDNAQNFELLGPRGVARVVKAEGIKVEAVSSDNDKWTPYVEGTVLEVPSFVRVRFPGGKGGSVNLDLEYKGQATTDYRGVVTPAAQAVRFGYSKFVVPIDWTVSFYNWNAADVADPHAHMPALKDLIKGEPVKVLKVQDLNFSWGGSPAEGVTSDHFATIAEGTVSIPAGDYTLNVTSDDGCRVWVDNKLVIADGWKYQGPTLYTTTVKLGGTHHIRIEHYEIDGFSALKCEIKPKKS